MARARAGRQLLAGLLAAIGLSCASAQSEGGLYVAGDGFGFQVAAQRALSHNPRGARFFLLVLPPETAALRRAMSGRTATLRQQVIAANGLLLVCQRDIDAGRVDLADLIEGVVAVRGWAAPGSADIPAGQRHFPGENPSQLPSANDALRRLRSTCS